jgi:hypothetical protein
MSRLSRASTSTIWSFPFCLLLAVCSFACKPHRYPTKNCINLSLRPFIGRPIVLAIALLLPLLYMIAFAWTESVSIASIMRPTDIFLGSNTTAWPNISRITRLPPLWWFSSRWRLSWALLPSSLKYPCLGVAPLLDAQKASVALEPYSHQCPRYMALSKCNSNSTTIHHILINISPVQMLSRHPNEKCGLYTPVSCKPHHFFSSHVTIWQNFVVIHHILLLSKYNLPRE